MTLKGQKNHYNVKLLRGYGVSINLKNNKVVLKGGSDVFTGQFDQEEWFVTQIPYERIVISGKGYISTEAIKLLTEKNINVILTDTYGNLVTAMHKVKSSPTAMNYRIGQYDAFRNPEKVAYLQKELLKSKLLSQIQFLKSIQKAEVQEAIDGLASYLTQIEKARDKRDLLTIESRSGYLYFRNYAKLFNPKYGFLSRHGGGLVMSNRYASDVVNGLLNYGYTILAGEIVKFVNGIGLDPYYGFMHNTHSSFQALVYDLIEPFRWLVEYAVYKLVVEEPKHGKTGQKVNRVIGNLFNPVIFAFITGHTRAKLYRFVIENNLQNDVVSFATDSICTTKKLDVNSTMLGEFSFDNSAQDVFYLQNGIYRFNGKWKQRGHGRLESKDIEHIDTIERHGRLFYKVKLIRSVRLRSSILQNQLSEIGKIKPITRGIKLNTDRKRFWMSSLESIDERICNDSIPISLNQFKKEQV